MTTFIKSLGTSLSAALALFVFTLPLTAANGGLVRIIQTNSAGDSVHIIDAATNKVIAEIPGIERAHGAPRPRPTAACMWISNEADNTVDVIDSKTMKVVKKIPLSGHPNNLAITPDGRKLYVAIAQAPGSVDVIDAAKQTKAKTISVHGGVHNTYVTPDGKFAVAGMIGARNITVIDTKTDMPVWTHYFDLGVRPIAFDTKPDGSTAMPTRSSPTSMASRCSISTRKRKWRGSSTRTSTRRPRATAEIRRTASRSRRTRRRWSPTAASTASSTRTRSPTSSCSARSRSGTPRTGSRSRPTASSPTSHWPARTALP